jgi:hypothetical protein
MGQVWTRDDWNQLIRKLNQVLQNPPGSTDCNAIAAIDEVDAGHRWTKSDIREVQDKLKAICKDNTFSAAADTPELWLQKTVDDINTAVSNGWCGCTGGNKGCPPGSYISDFYIGSTYVGRISGTYGEVNEQALIWELTPGNVATYPFYCGD